MIENNDIPTTNAADEHVAMQAETVHDGPHNEFQISGSGFACECSNILTREIYDIHGSRPDFFI